MSALYFLIGVSLIAAIGFLLSFVVSIKNGQYDDEYTPSVRILLDDEVVSKEKENNPIK